MSKYYLLFLLVCSISVSFAKIISLQGGESSYFEDQFRKTIQCIKNQIPYGFPSFRIPPLDPYKINETIDLRLDNKYIWTKIKLNHFTVDGGSSFDIISLTLTPLLKLEVEFRFQKVHANCSYSGEFNLLKLVQFDGDGDIDVEFEDVTVRSSTQYQMVPPLIGDYHQVITVGNAKAKITGVNNDAGLSEIISKLATAVASTLINAYKEDIAYALSPLVKNKANSMIGDLTFLDFLAVVTEHSCD